jgi:hypothetical protein
LFRRTVVDRLDARLSARDRVLNQVQTQRQRHHRLEQRLRLLVPIAFMSACIAVPGTALIAIRPVHLALAVRAAIAAIIAVSMLIGTVATAFVASAWIELHTLRHARHLYLAPTITTRDIADRLQSGWAPLAG